MLNCIHEKWKFLHKYNKVKNYKSTFKAYNGIPISSKLKINETIIYENGSNEYTFWNETKLLNMNLTWMEKLSNLTAMH